MYPLESTGADDIVLVLRWSVVWTMAGILGKAGLFVSRGVARFKYVQLLQEQTARKERERSDSIRGDNFKAVT